MIRFEDFVDIGGCRLHATVRGNGPTVVMERGADCGGVYGPLLDEVAEFATVVFYDRAGAGRSDPTATDYTVAGITANLRALLERLPVKTPAILVGWSLTGLSVLYHACKHSADVAGLVVIDSTPYDFFDDTSLAGRLDFLRFGIRQLLFGRGDLERFLRNGAGPAIDESLLGPYARSIEKVRRNEIKPDNFRRSCALTRDAVEAGLLPDVAILVLDAAINTTVSARLARRKHANYRRIVELAPRGRHVLVENGSHMMSLDRPDAIVDAVREVVAATSLESG